MRAMLRMTDDHHAHVAELRLWKADPNHYKYRPRHAAQTFVAISRATLVSLRAIQMAPSYRAQTLPMRPQTYM